METACPQAAGVPGPVAKRPEGGPPPYDCYAAAVSSGSSMVPLNLDGSSSNPKLAE